MTYRYHAEALSQDISYRLGCIDGRGNIAAVKEKIEQMRGQSGVRDAEVESAADQLAIYFEQLVAGLGEAAFKIALRQEIGGELLDGPDAEVLTQAEARKVSTTINKPTAKRLAKLISERAHSWKD
jgi:hypothetical protein